MNNLLRVLGVALLGVSAVVIAAYLVTFASGKWATFGYDPIELSFLIVLLFDSLAAGFALVILSFVVDAAYRWTGSVIAALGLGLWIWFFTQLGVIQPLSQSAGSTIMFALLVLGIYILSAAIGVVGILKQQLTSLPVGASLSSRETGGMIAQD